MATFGHSFRFAGNLLEGTTQTSKVTLPLRIVFDLTPRLVRRALIPASYLIFFAGMMASSATFYRGKSFDLKAAVISDLMSPEDNPGSDDCYRRPLAFYCGIFFAAYPVGLYCVHWYLCWHSVSPRSGTGGSSFGRGPVRGFTRLGLPVRCAGLLYERSAADQPRVLGVDIVRRLWGRLVGRGQGGRETLEEQLRRGESCKPR